MRVAMLLDMKQQVAAFAHCVKFFHAIINAKMMVQKQIWG